MFKERYGPLLACLQERKWDIMNNQEKNDVKYPKRLSPVTQKRMFDDRYKSENIFLMKPLAESKRHQRFAEPDIKTRNILLGININTPELAPVPIELNI